MKVCHAHTDSIVAVAGEKMRRADRLFQLIQILRRHTTPVTAATLAEELEVSTRTVYRDIADLMGQRVPIEGEPGSGYTLSHFYSMPPLMLTHDELEALLLGVQLVQNLPDKTLGNSANDVLSKIQSVIPSHLVSTLNDANVRIRPSENTPEKYTTKPIRDALRAKKKIRIIYTDQHNKNTERTVWPILLGYDENHCLLIAWCENKHDYRHFRIDRMQEIILLDETIPTPLTKLRQQWQAWRAKNWNVKNK